MNLNLYTLTPVTISYITRYFSVCYNKTLRKCFSKTPSFTEKLDCTIDWKYCSLELYLIEKFKFRKFCPFLSNANNYFFIGWNKTFIKIFGILNLINYCTIRWLQGNWSITIDNTSTTYSFQFSVFSFLSFHWETIQLMYHTFLHLTIEFLNPQHFIANKLNLSFLFF